MGWSQRRRLICILLGKFHIQILVFLVFFYTLQTNTRTSSVFNDNLISHDRQSGALITPFNKPNNGKWTEKYCVHNWYRLCKILGLHDSGCEIVVLVYVLFVLCRSVYCVLFACKCVLCCCHWVATQLQLTNISYHILSS